MLTRHFYFCFAILLLFVVYFCNCAPVNNEVPVYSLHCRNITRRGRVVGKECVERFRTRIRPPAFGLDTHAEINRFLALDALSSHNSQQGQGWNQGWGQGRAEQTTPYPTTTENFDYTYLFSRSGAPTPPYLTQRAITTSTTQQNKIIPVSLITTSTTSTSTTTTTTTTEAPTTTPEEEVYDDKESEEIITEEIPTTTTLSTTTTTTTTQVTNSDEIIDEFEDVYSDEDSTEATEESVISTTAEPELEPEYSYENVDDE